MVYQISIKLTEKTTSIDPFGYSILAPHSIKLFSFPPFVNSHSKKVDESFFTFNLLANLRQINFLI